MYIELAVFAAFVFCYSLVAGRVERAATSGPIVFVVAGSSKVRSQYAGDCILSYLLKRIS